MSDKQRISVLIVDDHELVRVGLRFSLEQFSDLQIIGEAETGQTAVLLALELNPNVVLMDIGLPGVNGIEACRQIKESLPSCRILMVTTHEHDDDVFAALAAGADGYCLKDFASDQIAMAIRVINAGAAWLAPGIARKVLDATQPEVQTVAPNKLANKGSKFDLSVRELDILELLVEGLSNHQMSERLYISTETVKTHMRHIMGKLAVSDRTQAAIRALKEGLLADDRRDKKVF